jgi:hypothetical protein
MPPPLPRSPFHCPCMQTSNLGPLTLRHLSVSDAAAPSSSFSPCFMCVCDSVCVACKWNKSRTGANLEGSTLETYDGVEMAECFGVKICKISSVEVRFRQFFLFLRNGGPWGAVPPLTSCPPPPPLALKKKNRLRNICVAICSAQSSVINLSLIRNTSSSFPLSYGIRG